MNSGGDKDAFISQFNIMNNIDIPEMSKSKLNLEIQKHEAFLGLKHKIN